MKTLSDMRRALDAHGIQLTKSLGQNFLHDSNQLRKIIAAANLQAGDRVLEIGPGLGPLTQEILQSDATELLAIEKDRRLIPLLQDRFKLEERLTLRQADALSILREESRDWSGWKLVSNLPYSVASPILVELALTESPPERIVATLQLEVVQRILARTNSADYGILTLLLSVSYEVADWFKVPRECFFPVPDVESGCVVLQRRAQRRVPGDRTGRYARLVKLAFSQRRKMMHKLLKQEWPPEQLAAAFAHTGIALTERAEKVSPEQFALLLEELDRESPAQA